MIVLGDAIYRQTESDWIAGVVMPHLGGVVDPMPMRTFTASKEKVDRCRRHCAIGTHIAEGLTEPTALGVWFQLEMIDDLAGPARKVSDSDFSVVFHAVLLGSLPRTPRLVAGVD